MDPNQSQNTGDGSEKVEEKVNQVPKADVEEEKVDESIEKPSGTEQEKPKPEKTEPPKKSETE